MNKKRVVGISCIILGIILLISSPSITGFAISERISSDFIFLFGLVVLVGGMFVMQAATLDDLAGYVRGRGIGTDEQPGGKKVDSPMYSNINGDNIEEIFQTPLGHKFGGDIKGAKAIVYQAYDGKYHTAFLTEAIDTHHRHAASTVAKLVDGTNLEDPSLLDEKSDSLYEGDSAKSCELLTKASGFELQYDPKTNKIIGVQQDSWLTKEQQRCKRKISKDVEEDMILELFSKIDHRYLSDELSNFNEETLGSLYADKDSA